MKKTYYYEMEPLFLQILSIIILIVLVIVTFAIPTTRNILLNTSEKTFDLSLLLLVPYFIFHEVLHSIGYVLNGAKFKNITFGMHLEKGILCCSCKQTIKRKTILWSLIYPFLFIGVITYILGIIFNSFSLLLLSIMNISGCSGDLIMFFAFLKIKDFEFFEYDNPMAFGLITKEKLDNKKLVGLKLYNEKNMTQTIDKKITISKTSAILILGYLLLLIIDCLI